MKLLLVTFVVVAVIAVNIGETNAVPVEAPAMADRRGGDDEWHTAERNLTPSKRAAMADRGTSAADYVKACLEAGGSWRSCGTPALK